MKSWTNTKHLQASNGVSSFAWNKDVILLVFFLRYFMPFIMKARTNVAFSLLVRRLFWIQDEIQKHESWNSFDSNHWNCRHKKLLAISYESKSAWQHRRKSLQSSSFNVFQCQHCESGSMFCQQRHPQHRQSTTPWF